MRICSTARLLVIDNQPRGLLLSIHDQTSLHDQRPDMTEYWPTPGDGEPDDPIRLPPLPQPLA